MNDDRSSTPANTGRNLTYAAAVGLLVVYLVVLQGLPWLTSIGFDNEYGKFPNTETVLRVMTIPVAVALVLVIAVITWLRWWPQVRKENNPVQRWVWLVPISFIGVSIIVTDYGNLADVGLGLTLTLIATSTMVGLGEEFVFRGISLETLRRHGMTERRVALWSSVIFGGVHLTNIITAGPGAIIQVLIVSMTGYLFYLTRRVSGGILVPVVMHAAWDFSLFSSNAGEDPAVYPLVSLAILVELIVIVIVIVKRHQIELDPAPESVTTG